MTESAETLQEVQKYKNNYYSRMKNRHFSVLHPFTMPE